MIEAYASGVYAEEFAALARFDPVEALENAGIKRLRQAREVATGLAGFGAILVMHALLMPDTPGLAALRARIDELGMGPALINLSQQMMQPRGSRSPSPPASIRRTQRCTSGCPNSLPQARRCCTKPETASTIPNGTWRPGSPPSAS